MYRLLPLSLIAFAAVCGSPTAGESLWPADENKSVCADRKAHKVGDVLTVVIVESATSSSSASTETSKDSKLQAGPGTGPVLDKIPLLKLSGGDQMKADGSTTRTSKFVAKMTAKVTKIDANGNLEIEGTKKVQTNKESEEIKLTGTIRPQDIQPDNTVLSTAMADAQITHSGTGPIGSRQKEGLISKILRILF